MITSTVLDANVDVNAQDWKGKTALSFAIVLSYWVRGGHKSIG